MGPVRCLCVFFLFFGSSWAGAHPNTLDCKSADAHGYSDYFEGFLQGLDTQCASPLKPRIQNSQEHPENERVTKIEDDRDLASMNRVSSCKANHDSIPRSCIKASMEIRGPIKGVNYYSCTGNKPRIVPPPCISDKFVDYIHNEVNKALECINSGPEKFPGGKLNPREIFGLFNRESRFMPNVASSGGIGLAQLVKSSGAKDFFTGPTRVTWNEVSKNAECTPYTTDNPSILGDPEFVNNTKMGKITYCQLANLQENPARSLIMGLSLYKNFKRRIIKKMSREYIDPSTGQVMTDKKSEFTDLVERLSQVAYNAGPGRAFQAYNSVKGRSGNRSAAASRFAHFSDMKYDLLRRYYDPKKVPVAIPDDVARVVNYALDNLRAADTILNPTDADLVVSKDQLVKLLGSNDFPVGEKIVANKFIQILKNRPSRAFTYSERVSGDLRKLKKDSGCPFVGM